MSLESVCVYINVLKKSSFPEFYSRFLLTASATALQTLLVVMNTWVMHAFLLVLVFLSRLGCFI